jgi:HK97 family phage portal protein
VRSLIGSFVNRSPVPLVSRRQQNFTSIFGGMAGKRDNRLLSTTAQVGTVFAIVNRITTGVAKLDWHLYKTAASGLKEDRTPVTSHAMIDLWNKPNPFMNRRRFVETAQQHVELVGENALITSLLGVGGKRIPIELWPVRPDRITVTPDPYRFIKGYVYHGPDGEEMPLDPAELQRIVMPNPRDLYRGLGPVESIVTDIDNVKFSSAWNRAFFENSAEPGGVIQVPTSLNDREFDMLRSQWAQDHKGVSKAHRVAILENDAKWVSNSFTHRDMQFAELRGVGRDVILEAWGMPKSVIGIVEDVNRANAEASEYLFSKWIIEERADRWRDLLNFELLPLYGATGEGLEWDYDSPVPENSDQENAAIAAKSTALALLTEKGFDAKELLEFFSWPDISYTKPEPPKIVAPPGAKPAPGEEEE